MKRKKKKKNKELKRVEKVWAAKYKAGKLAYCPVCKQFSDPDVEGPPHEDVCSDPEQYKRILNNL